MENQTSYAIKLWSSSQFHSHHSLWSTTCFLGSVGLAAGCSWLVSYAFILSSVPTLISVISQWVLRVSSWSSFNFLKWNWLMTLGYWVCSCGRHLRCSGAMVKWHLSEYHLVSRNSYVFDMPRAWALAIPLPSFLHSSPDYTCIFFSIQLRIEEFHRHLDKSTLSSSQSKCLLSFN